MARKNRRGSRSVGLAEANRLRGLVGYAPAALTSPRNGHRRSWSKVSGRGNHGSRAAWFEARESAHLTMRSISEVRAKQASSDGLSESKSHEEKSIRQVLPRRVLAWSIVPENQGSPIAAPHASAKSARFPDNSMSFIHARAIMSKTTLHSELVEVCARRTHSKAFCRYWSDIGTSRFQQNSNDISDVVH
jgi:hypothetical protein